MHRSADRNTRFLIATASAVMVLFATALWAGAGQTAAQNQQKKAPAGHKADPSQYVGAETCKGCHEDLYKNFAATPHWRTMLDTKRGPEWHGCEACHGPGAEHVNAGGDKSRIIRFAALKSAEISERCLECHQFSEEHSNFDRSAHARNNVSCIQCHSPHHSKERRALLVERQPGLCYRCHQENRSEFVRPFRHKVNEGLLVCTDCHNPHGGFLTRQLRSTAAQDQVCFKCHVDKAGPFVFEHVPMKSEGCVACHLPHGSNNARLLRRNQINILCLECHTLTLDPAGAAVGAPGIPQFHNQTQKYQACTMCHAQIHGSNASSVFFR